MATDSSSKVMERYAVLQSEFEAKQGYTMNVEMKNLLTRFGFNEADLTRQIRDFSGGQRTRLAFVSMLLEKPDILLLDEPTNHLDLSTIEWLEGYLKNYNQALIVVSHDRLFLDRVCDNVVELEHRKAIRYTGNYTSFLKQKEENQARQENLYHQQQREIERLETLIEKFRYKKNKAAFAQSKMKYLDRLERVDKVEHSASSFHANFQSKLRGGKHVLTCTDLEIGYGRALASLNLEILRQDRIGVIGDNGTGKSTLLKTIVGKIPALGGEMLLGHQIEIGYFDQELKQFNMQNTVLEELWDEYPDLDKTAVRTALGQFLFKGDDVFKSVAVLSGGEKVRLSLAKLLLKRANFLILDEPTNHLDIPAKEALEDALMSYDGTLLFVSHDRYFIHKLSKSLLKFEDGQVHLETPTEDFVAAVKNEVINTDKIERKHDYHSKKQLQREQESLEKKLVLKQEELQSARELRYDPEYYHDHTKMDELDSRIDDIHNEIARMENRWEEIALSLEESEGNP